MSDIFETDMLDFKEYDDGWWAIGEDNAEYHVWWNGDCYTVIVQKRVGWNSVSQVIGHYDELEDALYACDDYAPFEDGDNIVVRANF